MLFSWPVSLPGEAGAGLKYQAAVSAFTALELRWIKALRDTGWHAAPCEPKEIEMSPIGWTDALHLAFDPMDRVHREFIDLLAAAERADDAELVSAWGAVVDHTAVHFADEDRWMRETGFAGAADHQLQHRVVLNLLRYGLALARDGNFEAVREMALELDAWFAKHTHAMDAALALHMRSQPKPQRRARAPNKTVGGPTE
jgi:hemerythrin-like metal-binding protein